jgi:hypothetical protein
MTLCEFRFENVFLLGDDGHLDAMTNWLDDIFETQWVLDDATRRITRDGWWCLCFFRDANHHSSVENFRR